MLYADLNLHNMLPEDVFGILEKAYHAALKARIHHSMKFLDEQSFWLICRLEYELDAQHGSLTGFVCQWQTYAVRGGRVNMNLDVTSI